MNKLGKFLTAHPGAKVRAIQIGNHLRVFVGVPDADIEKIVTRGLAAGKTVVEGRTRRWWATSPVHDKTKPGSAAYTWKGDKVRAERFLCIQWPGHERITRRSLGFVWTTLD